MIVHHGTIWSDTDERKLSKLEVNLCYGSAKILDLFAIVFRGPKTDIPEYIEKMHKYYAQHSITALPKQSVTLFSTSDNESLRNHNDKVSQFPERRELPKYDEIGRKFLADIINRICFYIVGLATILLIIVGSITLSAERMKRKDEIFALGYKYD